MLILNTNQFLWVYVTPCNACFWTSNWQYVRSVTCTCMEGDVEWRKYKNYSHTCMEFSFKFLCCFPQFLYIIVFVFSNILYVKHRGDKNEMENSSLQFLTFSFLCHNLPVCKSSISYLQRFLVVFSPYLGHTFYFLEYISNTWDVRHFPLTVQQFHFDISLTILSNSFVDQLQHLMHDFLKTRVQLYDNRWNVGMKFHSLPPNFTQSQPQTRKGNHWCLNSTFLYPPF